MNTFVEALNRPAVKPVVARTDNGMRARATTASACVDLFGSIGASRGKDIIPAFKAALVENADLAFRIAQWARDVRGGAGERQLYRDILLWLEANKPDILVDSRLLDNVAEIGRFDDLLIFQTDQVKARAYEILRNAILAGNGLAAKWLPRKGAQAVELRRAFDMSPKQYRKTLVGLTKVVEQDMCAKNWKEINFSHVPSVAMSRYMTAFHRNAPVEFQAYKDALKRNDGTAKVNAGAVYPYQVIQTLGGARDCSYVYVYEYRSSYPFNQVAQSMWETLPNYMNDKNVLAVVDNSGSMQSKIPGSNVSMMDVATSLGLYVAEKSTGAFKNLSIGFSNEAAFVNLSGPINERLGQMCSAPWGSSTNLHSVFDLILEHAVSNRVPAEDMPSMIAIFSDMQFNHCVYFDDSAQQMIRRKYEDAGYEMPQVVFWNLNDAGNKPVKFDDSGVALVSGFSPAVMEAILAGDLDKFTPESVMLKAVNKERYNW